MAISARELIDAFAVMTPQEVADLIAALPGRTVSALPTITAVDLADADLFNLVDASAGANKKITTAELRAGVGSLIGRDVPRVSNADLGFDATLRPVLDGNGVASQLELSTAGTGLAGPAYFTLGGNPAVLTGRAALQYEVQAGVHRLVAWFPDGTTGILPALPGGGGGGAVADFFVADDGAVCDAAYDPNTNIVTGTDETLKLRATIARATAAGGGRIRIKGFLRTTDPITISNPLITFEGVGTFIHANGQMGAPGGIIYDHTAPGFYALAQSGFSYGLNLVNLGIYCRAGAAGAVYSEGAIYLEGCCLKNLDGAFGIPLTTYGRGLDTLPGISQVRLVNCHVSGFNEGVRISSGASSLTSCQVLYNRWNIHQTEGTLFIDGNCVIQDPVEGDLDIDYCGKFSMRDTNLEYGYSFDGVNHPPLMRIGHVQTYPGVKPNNVSVQDIFVAGNAEPLATAVIIERVDGLYFGPTVFVNSTGDIFHNLTNDPNARIYLGEPKIITGSPYAGTVIDNYTGAVEDELTGRRMFWNGFRVGAVARADTLDSLLPARTVADELKALGVQNGAVAYLPKARSLSEQLIDSVPSVGTTETTLYGLTIQPSTLVRAGDKFFFELRGRTVGHASATRRIKTKTGNAGTTIILDTGDVLTPVAARWSVKGILERRDFTSARVTVEPTIAGKAADPPQLVFDISGLDFTAAIALNLTGQAGGAGAANGDIVADGQSVLYVPASDAYQIGIYADAAHYWTNSEAAGANRVDVVGGWNTVPTGGTVTQTAGQLGNAAGFLAEPLGTLDYAYSGGLGMNQGSIAALIYYADVYNSFPHAICIGDQNGYVRVFKDSVVNRWRVIGAIPNDNRKFDLTGTTTISTGGAGDHTWYHVVVNWSAAGAELWINGVKEASVLTDCTLAFPSSGTIRFGSFFNRAAAQDWYGAFDDALLSPRPLTPEKIAYLYNAGLFRALYPLPITSGTGAVTFTDQGTAESIQDAVGSILTNTATVNLTYNDAANTITADVKADSLTAGLLHATATDVVFGRSTAGSGAGEQIAFTSVARTFAAATTQTAQRAAIGAVIGTDVQAYDAELAALAGLVSTGDRVPYFTGSGTAALAVFTAFARTLVADPDAATWRTDLGLAIGTNVQAYNNGLQAIAGLTSAADRLAYFTGAGTAALATFTAFARTLVDDPDAPTARTTLGLGTAALLDSDTDATLAANSDFRIPTQKAIATYVQALTQSIQWKNNVRAATLVNGTFATAFANGQTVGGVVVATGDRIALLGQTDGTQNGGYVVPASGAPTRSTDMDAGSELPGARFRVSEGTNANKEYTCTNTSVTLGTTVITFIDTTGGGATYTAGFGLGLSGNTFSVTDPELVALAGTTAAANKGVYFDSTTTAATYDLTSFGRTFGGLADAAAGRTNLGLVIGTNVQAYDAELAALAGLTSAADQAPYFTGTGTAALMTVTAAARTVLDDTTTGAMLATLGAAPVARTLTGTAPVTVNGDNAAHDLSANLTVATAAATGAASGVARLGQIDSGATLPAGTPLASQLFLHTPAGRAVLHEYDGAAWQALESLGGVTVYVDGASGTNAADKGFGTGANAYLTIQYAIDRLPGKLAGNVIVNVASGTYREQVTIQGKTFTGNYTLTILGATTNIDTGTATGGANPVGNGSAGYGTLTNTGKAYTVNALRDTFLETTGGTGSGQSRIIHANTATVITIVGRWDTVPDATTTYRVYTLPTRITGSNAGADTTPVRPTCFTIRGGQRSVVLQNLKINYAGAGDGQGGVYVTEASGAQVTLCEVTNNNYWNTQCSGASTLSLIGNTYRAAAIGDVRVDGNSVCVPIKRCRLTGGQNRSIDASNGGVIYDLYESYVGQVTGVGIYSYGGYVGTDAYFEIDGSTSDNIVVQYNGLFFINGVYGAAATQVIKNAGGWGATGGNGGVLGQIASATYSGNTAGTFFNIPLAHATTHKTGGADAIRLDELAAPTGGTTLDATTAVHGLLKQLSGNPAEFFAGDGNWSLPLASYAPGSFTVPDGRAAVFVDNLTLTGSQTATVLGTGSLRII